LTVHFDSVSTHSYLTVGRLESVLVKTDLP
jgi:hypothetical protein